MNRHILPAVAAATLTVLPVAANAEIVVVDARTNSSTGGVGATTSLTFVAGQIFRVSSSLNDLWRAGDLPRFSDANGLVADRFATAADDSGETPGTLIGTNFGPYSQDGFTAPYGALVARFGGPGGIYQLIGANFQGAAAGSGPIELFYWDSNNGDNTGSISFNVLAGVPEPATWAFMILGFGAIGGALRARRRVSTKVSYA